MCFGGGTVERCLVTGSKLGNTFMYRGGGICSIDGGTINNSEIRDNISDGDSSGRGGGVYIEGGGTINNSLITGNSGADTGGGIYIEGAAMNNCTVVGNSVRTEWPSSTGGGVSAEYGSLVNNSIIYSNTRQTSEGEVLDNWSAGDMVGGNLNYSCTTPKPAGRGNIVASPLFVAAVSGDYHLQPASSCLDAGLDAFASGETDLDGNPRIQGLSVDMGVYESERPYYYVSPNGSYEAPYATWGTAARTIQAAINVAAPNGVVRIADGTYTGPGNRDIEFNGKSIMIMSENGPEDCIIDCEHEGRGFYFDDAEGARARLRGLTIKKGFAEHGAGIYCFNASPTIVDCRVVDGIAVKNGGGIYCENGATPALENCVVANNVAPAGGAIYSDGSEPILVNCTLARNEAVSGGGIYSKTLSPIVLNSILWGNGAGQIAGPSGAPIVTYSAVEDGYVGDGNVDVDPLLTGTYRLRWDSPCVNAGDVQTATLTDIDSEQRSDPPDMGADEFVDTDGDHMADVWETRYGLDPDVDDASGYLDDDELNNLQEYEAGVDPNEVDGDADGLPDWWELQYFGDLRQRGFNDFDHDGISNIDEFDSESDPSAGPEIGEQVMVEKELVSWYLFPSVPDQALAENGGIIMTREIEMTVIGKYDRFYISSSPDGAGGWDLTGVRIDVEAGGTMYPVCGYGHTVDADDSLDITGNYGIPSGNTKINVHIRYDGSGTIGIDAPLYLLKWSPSVVLNTGTPEGEPFIILLGGPRQIPCSLGTTPPSAGAYNTTVVFGSSLRNGTPDVSFNPASVTLDGSARSVAVTALTPSTTRDDTTITAWSANPITLFMLTCTLINPEAVMICKLPDTVCSDCGGTMTPVFWSGKIGVALPPYDGSLSGIMTLKVGNKGVKDASPAQKTGGICSDPVNGDNYEFDPVDSADVPLGPARIELTWKLPGVSAVTVYADPPCGDILSVEFDNVWDRNLDPLASGNFPDYDKCIAIEWDSAGEVDLENYLKIEPPGLTFDDVDDVVSLEIETQIFGSASINGSVLDYANTDPGDTDIYAFAVRLLCGGDVVDRLIVVIFSGATQTAYQKWTAGNVAPPGWLGELPAVHGSLGANNTDPEPGAPAQWGGVNALGNNYHYSAAFDMRSVETAGGHGHQTCYDANGDLIEDDV